MKGFLYGQTEYNILKNTNRLDDYISLAKKHSFDFLSITDSNMFGHYKFYNKCIKEGIKPIIGLEYSFKTEDQNYSNALLYAKNNNGYKNLLKITSLVKTASIESLEDIVPFLDGIAVIFVFNDSFFERLLYSKEFHILSEYCDRIRDFDEAYIGISYTNKLDKLNLNKEMEDYAYSHGLSCLPIHQCLYLTNRDVCVYEALNEIGNNHVQVRELDDYSFEINPLFDQRLDDFINSINIDLFSKRVELPKYPYTKGVESVEYLKALCFKGLEKRGKYSTVYIERLNYELSIIHKMGFDDYFLIVWDFIKYAKQNSILVGPGRGSAAGSLVAYTLGITDVDPITYDLLFERFLNPERISMPDIDTDFPDIHRDQVITHVQNVYGKGHVCNISTYGTFLVKSSIRDLARVKKMDVSRAEKIIDAVEQVGFDKLLEEYKDNDLYEFLYIAKNLEGLPRHVSTHAAGIILSAKPLDEIIPLQEGINGMYQSQLEASDLEKIGLLKMDFLGIRNLTMINGMMSDIKGFDVKKLREIKLDDPKVYQLLQKGDTLGIFQLESPGIRNVLRKLKPTCFEDLVAVLALYRPGPMDNIDEYIRRKHNGNFEYLHPKLEPILKSTYGIIVYQEQIMKIAQVFAGYTLGEADVLRRAVSKKDSELLKKLEADFVNKSISMGYEASVAKNIYDLIYKFANYGFNKSHSVAYSIVSYQMAYFKANYFTVFMANILNNVIGSTQTLVSYIKYAKEYNVETKQPNINVSTTRFVTYKNTLYMPLNSIFSIGDVVAKEIVLEREKNGIFKDFKEFKSRCSFLNSQVLQALIYSGALNCFGKTKKSMTNISTKEDELFLKYMDNLIEDNTEYEYEYLKEMEFKYLGINLEYNIFKNIEYKLNKYKANYLNTVKMNSSCRLLVTFTDVKEIVTKNSDKMLVGTLEDASKTTKFVIFSKTYNSLTTKIEKNKLYLIAGYYDIDNRENETVRIDKIALID